jgi:hypothetical protein
MRPNAARRRGRRVRRRMTRASAWEDMSALGGTRTPNLLIRSSRHIVQHRPMRSVPWADIPELSTRDQCCPAAWQQYWQQSRRNGLRASRGHASVVRRPSSRLAGAVERPFVFQAGHVPQLARIVQASCAVAGRRWLLLLLSPLLSNGPAPGSHAGIRAARDSWHLGALALITIARPSPGNRAVRCPAQAPPPNPIAAGPDGRRVLSRVGVADHAVTPEAPWTGSGWHRHSYGGFGGGHSQFQPHSCGRQFNLSSMGRCGTW